MENASKALLMAGGILIAMLIIVALIFAFNSIGNFYSNVDRVDLDEEIVKFNLQFEAYNRDDVKGIELRTLMNKINDYNNKYNQDGYSISTNIDAIFKEHGVTLSNMDSEFKGKIFKCTHIHYNSSTRRVDKIEFGK